MRLVRRRPPSWALVLGAGLLAAAFLRLTPDGAAQAVHYLGTAVLPLVVAARSLHRRGVRSAGWWLVLAGAALESGGEVVWDVYDLVLDRSPFPSPGDGLFLLGQLTMLAGTLALAPPRAARRSGRGSGRAAYASPLAEVLVVGLTAGLLSWRYVVSPTLDGSQSALAQVISLAYPTLDVVLLAALARLAFEGATRHRAVLLLAASMAASLVADVAFALQDASGSYADGGWVDSCWLAGYVLAGVAALHPSAGTPLPQAPARVVTQRRLALVMGCGALGPVLLLVEGASRGSVRATGGVTVVVLLLVLYRSLTLLSAFERSAALAAHRSSHDALTGLANRRSFVELLGAELAAGRDAAVLRLDLDGFKAVNDAAGQLAGDEVLRETAHRVAELLAPGAVLARLAADEFGVLLAEPEPGAVEALADQLVERLRAPFVVEGQQFWLRASVGSATLASAGAGTDALMGAAALALLTARVRGGGRAVAHAPALDVEVGRRPLVAGRLQYAIEHDELEVHYQPLVDRAGAVVGAEALVRWRRAGRLVPPGDFLPAARSAGLMGALDTWVLDRALAQLARWRAQGRLDVHLAVNLSVASLERPGLVAEVVSALRAHGVPSSSLVLELTEEAAASGPGIRRRLADLRAAGIRIALDDFGTGYSSLAYLEGMPADVLKVAKELVDPLAEGAGGRVVQALVGLAHSYGLTVIAEGVEQEVQRERLTELEVDWFQGWLFGRPVPADALTALLGAASRRGPDLAAAAAN
ncbi:putative bifunctional diguanylate cyclase/phosphodiesterase [Motilibacter peucedani]|uniref:putative bifunctional diguanylate cyclase/phosphodiesterase n=1 Tax=Motilibacter peucedani TaxID=598650 RepID=UPI000EB3458B|nr:bifunctional diguanylate cyclase/phosphodiesterase [Motilibacter peucedani]